jgi:cytochrome c oxidase subunit III
MSQPYAAVNAAELPALINGRDAPIWWGIVGLILIECVVFSALIISYFYLGFMNTEWPLAGVENPDLLLPSIGTAAILASSLSMYIADKGIKKNKVQRLKWGLVVSVLFAAVFLALKAYEYSDKGYRWDSHAYGSIVWVIIFFHSAHVVSLGLKTVVVATLSWRGFFTKENRIAVTVNGFYWHFVVLVWIPLFATLYLSPRLG